MNTQPTDAEIEAIVADAIAREAALAGSEAQPPSSAIVWWRAQLRARREAAALAEKPITVVHALAIAKQRGAVAGHHDCQLLKLGRHCGGRALGPIRRR